MADRGTASELSQSVGFSSGPRRGSGATVCGTAGCAEPGRADRSGRGDLGWEQVWSSGGKQFFSTREDAAGTYPAGQRGGCEVEPGGAWRTDTEQETGGATARG